jgi:hypothetical protein
MLRSMHGMLSAAVVMAAFAAIAGTGGYTAVWLYRTGPGRAKAPDEPQAPDEQTPDEPQEAQGRERPGVPEEGEGPRGPGGLVGLPGAQLYVLGEPRPPGR